MNHSLPHSATPSCAFPGYASAHARNHGAKYFTWWLGQCANISLKDSPMNKLTQPSPDEYAEFYAVYIERAQARDDVAATLA